MTIDLVLADVCKEFGIQPDTIVNKESFCLVFNNSIKINFTHISSTLIRIYCYLFPEVSEEKTPLLCRKIMSQNAYGAHFGNVIISISDPDRLFIASQTLDLTIFGKENFIKEIKKIIAVVEEARQLYLSLLEHQEPQTTKKQEVSEKFIKI